MVIYVTRDLMFSARVRPTVASQGKTLKMASSIEDCLAKWPGWIAEYTLGPRSAVDQPSIAVVVDLKAVADPTTLKSLIDACHGQATDQPLRTLAYGPHVHVELLAAAEAAGFDSVMTQGQFDRGFANWLAN